MTLSILQLAIAFVLSVLASIILYRMLSHFQVLDHPNDRSSHHFPTPKGGGAGFILVICTFLIVDASFDNTEVSLHIMSLGLLTVIMAMVGLLDDLKDLSVNTRFSVQVILSTLVVAFALSTPALAALSPLAYLGYFVAGLLFLLWCTNLYNFMDGIDGLAAVQGILCGMLIYTLNRFGYYPGTLGESGLLVSICCLSFLLVNFPPAKIFMGDTGSAALGFLIAGIALMEYGVDGKAFWIWVISLAGFVADASATLLIRLWRGEKVYQAHRSHLYQLFTINIQSKLVHSGVAEDRSRTLAHRKFLLIFTLIFGTWQTPCSILVATNTVPGLLGAALCILPLTIGAIFLGAGRERLTMG